jgi:hypothetical protein
MGDAHLKASLTRRLTEDCLLPLAHLDRQLVVSRLALLDDDIGHEG